MQWRIVFVCFLMVLVNRGRLFAQQVPSFSNYLYSLPQFNPAAAGSMESISAGFFYRSQWNQMPSAPSTQALQLHAPVVHNSIGIGAIVMNDQQGPLKVLTISGLYAYKINFKKGILSFGLRAGIKQYRISAGLLDPKDAGDKSLPTTDVNFILPDIGAGIYYHSPGFQLSVSSLQLSGRKIGNIQMSLSPYFYLVSSYLINKKGYINFQPALFLKSSSRGEFQGDFSMMAKSPEITLGMTYKTIHVLSFQLAVHLNKLLPQLHENITFGYAYDHFFTPSGFGNGANEFFLQYNFKLNSSVRKVGKEPKIHAPRFF